MHGSFLNYDDSGQPVAGLEVHDPHALGRTSGLPNTFEFRPYYLTLGRYGEYLRFFRNDLGGDDFPGFGSNIGRPNARPAAILELVFLKRGLLAETVRHDHHEALGFSQLVLTD